MHSIQITDLNTIQFMRTLEILQSMRGLFTTLIWIITQHITQPIGTISGTHPEAQIDTGRNFTERKNSQQLANTEV